MLIHTTLRFLKGYIANPYWPAMERIITIRKQSGVDRARSEAKRAASLKAWLDTHDLTLDDYKALETAATRPFHTAEDGMIVIPAHQLHGFMANVAALAPSAIRLAKPEQIRNVIEWGDLRTGKSKPDGMWDRFVRNPLTNQRRLQSSNYIADFQASGSLQLIDEDQEKKAREFIAWGGREVGVGAARKMGWGRFDVITWKADLAPADAAANVIRRQRLRHRQRHRQLTGSDRRSDHEAL